MYKRQDITLRALEVLENVDEIAAEDTRQTLKLLNHFNIKKPLFSYHQHNEQGKSDEIVSKLELGKNIAIVTDAGTPGISDPGSVVVRKCIENTIAFEVLPGDVYKRQKQDREVEPNSKTCLSSDCRLKLAYMKLELLVIANQNVAVNTFPGLVHTARHTMRVGNTQSA